MEEEVAKMNQSKLRLILMVAVEWLDEIIREQWRRIGINGIKNKWNLRSCGRINYGVCRQYYEFWQEKGVGGEEPSWKREA